MLNSSMQLYTKTYSIMTVTVIMSVLFLPLGQTLPVAKQACWNCPRPRFYENFAAWGGGPKNPPACLVAALDGARPSIFWMFCGCQSYNSLANRTDNKQSMMTCPSFNVNESLCVNRCLNPCVGIVVFESLCVNPCVWITVCGCARISD